MGRCGNADAGYVGAYKLNMTCDSGFYDLIHGGTCWKAPDDDGHAAWERSADSVDSDTAFWRDALAPAVWDKYGLAWDCSSGQFWDAQDQHGNIKGSCWHCPSDYPDRWMAAVWSSTACRAHQTRPATFLKFNGCSAPDKTTMYPNDLRRPGQPFLDIGSGIYTGDSGGSCWTCPVTDEQGNYLYTERGLNALNGKTGNRGCAVRFRYKPGRFVEPGLSGLPGVTDVLIQEQVFQRPDALTTFLYGLAQARNFSGAAATRWVTAQWQDIAAHPYQNAQIKALMHQYLIGSAPSYMYASGAQGTGTADALAAHTKLANSFQEYMRARRTYIAQEALDMYYAWKNNVGVTRSLHAESQLQTLFYYGTVPLDFSSIVAAALTPTATAGAVLTSIIGAQKYGDICQANRVQVWNRTTKNFDSAVPRQLRVSNLLSKMFKPPAGGVGGAGSSGGAGEPQGYIDDAYAFKPTPSGLGAGAAGEGGGEGAELGGELAGELAGEVAGESAAEGAIEAIAVIAAQIDLAAGPVGIALAGAEMAAMAIQQVVEIAQAEPNLIQAKNTAMNLDFSKLMQDTNGPDQIATYWSYATGVMTEPGDRQVNAMAQGAYAAAQQSNFAQLQSNRSTTTAQQPAPAQQAATQQTYTTFMSASATLLPLLHRVTDGPSAKAGQAAIQNAMTTYNQAKARLAGANLGGEQQNAANSVAQQVTAEITRIKGIPAAAQVLADTFAMTKYHGAD
jgi:hypothetical protein